jgi:dTDP-4-amino-4,6-dideoxygalactose transaminase
MMVERNLDLIKQVVLWSIRPKNVLAKAREFFNQLPCLDISHIERHITTRTRAMMVVHLFGQACWSAQLEDITKKYNLKNIEDNSQAAGATVWGLRFCGPGLNVLTLQVRNKDTETYKRTGSLSLAAGHGFYPGKNMSALGYAGAVTTDDDELADVIRTIAINDSRKKYQNLYKGLNSRPNEIRAAVLRVKLNRLDTDNQRRRKIAH